ncbi:DUF4142 domain-containing protein [Sphingomonas sp. Y38-1Y]|uniref:DUF4142 domain-containing protein n=1 Tax=Sphingomonas sp. Y38-1Y TaxID=3078265 RepID=UPI0028EFFBE4|nr:DUF4142 domain-containing protein [Sphingomonas sp. Y38-1Y]
MNRRQLAQTLVMGAVCVASMPALAFAQAPAGGPEREHAMETLRIGSLALQSSELAQRKANGPVRDFATFEVAEQTTIAQILREATGMAPPPPDAEARAIMARLNAATGRAFETAYIAAQTDGHRKLLQVQERYLASGRNPDMRHVAMLAKGQITEHLKHLENLHSGKL